MSDSKTSGSTEPSGRPVGDEVDLVDLIGVLWRRKWLILGLPFLAGLALVTFHLISTRLPPEQSPAPDVYTPQALALLHTEFDPLGGRAATGLHTMTSLFAGGSLGVAHPAGLAMRLARSDSFVDVIAQEFNFLERYDFSGHGAPRHAAREMIRGKLRLSYDEATGVLEIGYTDVDRQLATSITNRVTELLDARMASIGSVRERTRMELIEQKLVEVEREVERLETQIAAFQARHGVLDVRSLAEAQLATIALLRERVIATEIEIATYADFVRADDPAVRRLRSERDNLRRLVREIQSGYEEFEGLMPTQQELPRIALAFERLMRESRVQEQLLASLNEQYELARLVQSGTAPLFQVLEAAEVPEMKSGPARATAVVVGTLAAGVFAVFLAFVMEFIRNVRRDPLRLQKLRGRTGA